MGVGFFSGRTNHLKQLTNQIPTNEINQQNRHHQMPKIPSVFVKNRRCNLPSEKMDQIRVEIFINVEMIMRATFLNGPTMRATRQSPPPIKRTEVAAPGNQENHPHARIAVK